jgi:localization factor PodJL
VVCAGGHRGRCRVSQTPRDDQLKLDPDSLGEAEKAVAAWTRQDAVATRQRGPGTREWAEISSANSAPLVTRAQTLLNQLGYDAGAPDGLMGVRTREAIKSFERKNGLDETGQATMPLIAKLERLTS